MNREQLLTLEAQILELAAIAECDGLQAVVLLVQARALATRYLERPGVTADECRAFVKRVDQLLRLGDMA